jgi:Spy/CpxP family protein refolding chaperone
MMGKKTVMVLVCFVAFIYPAAAEAMRDGPPPGRWWRTPEMSAALELSQADRDALDELYVQNRRSLIDVKNDLDKERFELENILEQQILDEQAAVKQFKKIERIREKLSMERFRYLLEVRKILGHERHLKLVNMAREFHDKRGSGREEPLPLQ